MTMRFEVSDAELLVQSLEEYRNAVSDLRPYFAELVRHFERIQRDWFATQGRGSWRPLSSSYAAWKALVAPSAPLLVLNGDLRESPIAVRESESEIQISINAPFYWMFHQFGTVKMPARPPYVIDQETQDVLGESLARQILRRFDGI